MSNNNEFIESLLILESGRDRIVGNIMEIIEATGLPERQESSVKFLIKKVLYEEMEHPNAIRVPYDLYLSTKEEVIKRIHETECKGE